MANPRIEPLLAIEGWTSAAELSHLYQLARQVHDGCIVEVGGYRGRSTAALALGSMDGANVPVFCIEPHEVFEGVLGGRFGPADRAAFFRNMLAHGTAEQVRLVNLRSEVVAPGWRQPVALLWIDGDHRYEGVRADLDCWAPHLTPGATLVFDDAGQEGPARVIAELTGWRVVERVGKTATLRRSPAQP